nr:nuclear envelope integral membrane protein 2 isoform X3 [Anser cygnoides]
MFFFHVPTPTLAIRFGPHLDCPSPIPPFLVGFSDLLCGCCLSSLPPAWTTAATEAQWLCLHQHAQEHGGLPWAENPLGENCSLLKEGDVIQKRDENCYCYVQNRTLHLQYIWSTVEVKINSTETFRFVPTSEKSNCRNSETVFEFAACAVQIFWQPETSTETFLKIKQYGEDICFKIQPLRKELYIVSVKREMLDGKLLFLFVAGIFLFHFANSLSRNTKFFYLSGVILGVLALLVFVLLTLKRFIPRHSTFWILMSGCWMSSLYVIFCFKENMEWLWSEHRIYLLGYFLAVGASSFATCYQHGPLTSELSITLFTWTLQLTAFVLIYCGVTVPQVAYAIIAVSLCSKGLCYPLGAACHIGRKMKNRLQSKKLVFRWLTEEEYREQGEAETIRALEELRSLCRNPDFPSWLAVSKLQSPHRSAQPRKPTTRSRSIIEYLRLNTEKIPVSAPEQYIT